MAGRSISALIKLEGAEEIQRLLKAIGTVGEQAFAQVTAAVAKTNSSLALVSASVAKAKVEIDKFAEAGRDVGDAFNKFGSAARSVATRVAGISAIAVAAATAMTAFGVSAVKSADDLGEMASSLGLTTDAYQKLQFAAVQAGVSQEQFAVGIAKFSKQVDDAAKEESKALLTFAETAGKVLPQAGVTVVQFGRNFAEEFRVIREAVPALQEQYKALGITLSQSQIREGLLKLANGTAAQRKEFAALTGQNLPAVNEGLEQLRDQAESGGNALRRLGIRVRDGANNIRPIEDILGDVAEKFKGMPEGAQRTALALELFGKAGAKMGSFLSQGRAGIAETIKELERLGILLSKEEVDAADKAANAFDILGLAARNLKTRLGLVFAGPLREGAASLTRILTQNQAGLLRFAQSIEAKVTPVIRDLIRLLSGDEAAIENKWIIEARDNILEFATAVKGAVTNIIVPAFRGLMAVLDSVAKLINSVFGTTLTGGQIGIAIVVAKVIGAFGLLTAGIKLALAALRLFAFTPLGLIITGLTLIVIFWDDIAKAIGHVNQELKRLPGFATAVQQLGKDWQDVKKTFLEKGWLEAIKQDWAKFKLEFNLGKAKELWASDLAAIQALFKPFFDQLTGDWNTTVDMWEKRWEKFKKLVTESPVQGGTTAPEIPLPQSAPGVAPREGLLQPASLTSGGQKLQSVVETAKAAITALETLATTALQLVRSLARETGEVIGVISTSVADLVLVFQQVAAAGTSALEGVFNTIARVAAALPPLFSIIVQGAAGAGQSVVQELSAGLNSIFVSINKGLADLAMAVDAILANIVTRLDRAIAVARVLAQVLGQAQSSPLAVEAGIKDIGRFRSGGPVTTGDPLPAVNDGTPFGRLPRSPNVIDRRFAHGGAVRGAGTGTSDSILAWLSNGEFIQTAAAVRYYGASFMAALNRRRLPRDMLQGFNMGGLVDGLSRSLTGFAAGGLVAQTAGGRHISVDLRTDAGTFRMTTDEDTAIALTRVARRSGNNSTTRRAPAWDR